MTDAKKLFMAGVARAAVGTPYVVTETNDGFDVQTNIKDEMWLSLSSRSGVDKLYIHKVRVLGNAYRILDDFQKLRWVSGKPIMGSPGSATYARTFSLKAGTTPAPEVERDLPEGEIDPAAGRRLIVAVGDELGLIQHPPGSRLGLLLTGIAILLTLFVMFGVAAWVLFFG